MNHIFLLEDDETLGRGIAMALTGPEPSVVCRPSLSKSEQKLLRVLVENRGACGAPDHSCGPSMDGLRGICGGKRPVRHGQATAEQAGISENGVWHRLYVGGEAMTAMGTFSLYTPREGSHAGGIRHEK